MPKLTILEICNDTTHVTWHHGHISDGTRSFELFLLIVISTTVDLLDLTSKGMNLFAYFKAWHRTMHVFPYNNLPFTFDTHQNEKCLTNALKTVLSKS